MEKSGQIQELMDLATRSLATLSRRGDVEDRKVRVVATLARYRIFTHSTVQKCTVDSGEHDETGSQARVYVSVDTCFTAPDGSCAIVHTYGEAAGEFADASVDAAEQARWIAMSECLEVAAED